MSYTLHSTLASNLALCGQTNLTRLKNLRQKTSCSLTKMFYRKKLKKCQQHVYIVWAHILNYRKREEKS